MRQIRKKWVLAFEEHLRTGEKSKATVEKYRRAVRQFALFAAGRTVDKALVLAYRERLGREYTPSGANAALAALNGFLRFVGRSDCCVRPFKVQRTAYCPEEKELTKTEYARLAEAAKGNRRLCLLLQTLCATGIRVSELRHITAEAVRRGKAVVTCKGKTRVILLPGSLQKKLSRYIRERQIAAGPVFVTRTGKPLDRSNIWREMKGLCARAGVAPSKVFPHNLRHLFARTFYALEKDIAKLADLLGHSRIDTTRIYIMTTGAEHRRQLERMHLIL